VQKIKVETLPVGQLKANCYLVFDEEKRDCIIIDPGDAGDYIIRRITDLELTPKKIILTHGHFDHIQAALEIKLAYNIPVLMHRDDSFLLKSMQSSIKYFLHTDSDPAVSIDKYLKDKDLIKLNTHEFKIIHTPGHTPGSISVYNKSSGIIFVGDLVFKNGLVGRADFKYSDKELLNTSIEKILKLPNKTIIFFFA